MKLLSLLIYFNIFYYVQAAFDIIYHFTGIRSPFLQSDQNVNNAIVFIQNLACVIVVIYGLFQIIQWIRSFSNKSTPHQAVKYDLPHIEIDINNVKFPALVSTGSSFSVIRYEEFQRLKIKEYKKERFYAQLPLYQIECIGTYEANVKIGSKTKPVLLLIASKLPYDVILGSDALTTFGVLLTISGKKIKFEIDGEIIPTL